MIKVCSGCTKCTWWVWMCNTNNRKINWKSVCRKTGKPASMGCKWWNVNIVDNYFLFVYFTFQKKNWLVRMKQLRITQNTIYNSAFNEKVPYSNYRLPSILMISFLVLLYMHLKTFLRTRRRIFLFLLEHPLSFSCDDRIHEE